MTGSGRGGLRINAEARCDIAGIVRVPGVAQRHYAPPRVVIGSEINVVAWRTKCP
jgi:hypothetical protein